MMATAVGSSSSLGGPTATTLAREFEPIYLNEEQQNSAAGKLKIAEAGLGWKESTTGRIVTIHANEMKRIQWLRAARLYQLRITQRDGKLMKFEGFKKEAFDSLNITFKSYYQMNMEIKEMSLRGWNWGRTDFQSSSTLSFLVGNKPAFELPLNQVANTSLASKNEVSMEFVSKHPAGGDENNPKKRMKEDSMVEMRFYIPGMAKMSQVGEGIGGSGSKYRTLKQIEADKEGDDEDGDVDVDMDNDEEKKVAVEDGEITAEAEAPVFNEEGDAVSAASLFCDTIRQLGDVGTILGEAIVSFNELLCLTPRGRFELELHSNFFRLRGKTHDYKVLFTSIVKMFLIPKPDDLFWMFVIGLEPPLRQGQTRYPFLVFQFEKEDEIEVDLNLTPEDLEKYNGKLDKSYDAPSYEVVGEVFSGLSDKKLITSDYKGAQNQAGIKCSYKANEAFLYPLEKSFLSIPKPPIFIPNNEIVLVTFSRVGSGGSTSTKTFEVKFGMDNGQEYSFSSIPREEYQMLHNWCKDKNLSVENEFAEGSGGGQNVYAEDDSDLDDSDDDDSMAGDRKRKRTTNDIDMNQDFGSDESEDEDFVGGASGSESSAASSSDDSDRSGGGSESDSDASNASKEKVEKPKKVKKKKAPKEDVEVGGSDSGDDASSLKKTKTKKKVKDPNAPKRNMSAFMFFSNEMRASVNEANPGIGMTEVSKELGKLWKELSEDDRKKYDDLASGDKIRYQDEMKSYVPPSPSALVAAGKDKPVKKKKVEASAAEKKSTMSAEFVDSDED